MSTFLGYVVYGLYVKPSRTSSSLAAADGSSALKMYLERRGCPATSRFDRRGLLSGLVCPVLDFAHGVRPAISANK